MPFTRPTLQILRDRAKADLRTATGVKAIVRRSFLDVLSKAISGLAHMLHGHIVYVSRQIFPDQADAEFLARHGKIYSISRKEATFAKINVVVTGTDGETVPSGQIWKRDDGLLYTVESDVLIASGIATVVMTAQSSGSSGNLDAGEILTIQSPVANIDSEATVDSANVVGEDEEGDESYRDRIVARIQEPPSGGTVADFKNYALEIVGITRVWVRPAGFGEGTVVVYVVTDNEDPIIPIQAKLDEVQGHIDEKKPVTSQTFVTAPIPTELDIVVNLNPNSVDVQNAVKAEIKDLLAREANVRDSYRTVGTTYTGIIPLSKIKEAISIAAGEEDHELLLPTEDVVPSTGGLVIEGDYTFGAL